MAAVDDRFAEHRIHASLSHAFAALELAENESDTPESTEALASVRRLISSVSQVLDGVDAVLVPSNLLEELANSLDVIKSRLDSFTTTKDNSHLTSQMVADSDSILRNLGVLNGLALTGAAPEGLQGAVSTFRKSAGQHVANIGNQVAEVKASIESVRSDVAAVGEEAKAQKARTDSIVSDLQQQVSASLEEWRQPLALPRSNETTSTANSAQRWKTSEVSLRKKRKMSRTH